MKHKPVSSSYIEEQRKLYSLYVIQTRAIGNIADGMIYAMRRLLWCASKVKEIKTSSLAGNSLAYHPHSPPEDTINQMASKWANQYPYFLGHGAFGTLLKPDSFAAGRYTTVEVSEFTKDVIFPDSDILQMVDNFDGTLKEPEYYLPLVPMTLINPAEGIAIGFARNILPRKLSEVISAQIKFLEGKNIDNMEFIPYFKPLDCTALRKLDDTAKGNQRWYFEGTYEKTNATEIRVTALPYGLYHTEYVNTLNKMAEDDLIVDYLDNSKNSINITIKFARGILTNKTHDEIIKLAALGNVMIENLTILNFCGTAVLPKVECSEIIKRFTEWRLGWYVHRYIKLLDELRVDIQRYLDILCAIKNNVGTVAKKVQNKAELIDFLVKIKIVHTEYISQLPIYRFTEEEKNKVEAKLAEARITEKEYIHLIENDDARSDVYKKELKNILTKYK